MPLPFRQPTLRGAAKGNRRVSLSPRNLLLLLVLALTPLRAGALEFALTEQQGAHVLTLRGEIARDDAGRVERLLRLSAPVVAVRFDSTGGNLTEAFAIGRLLRRQRVAARVPDGAVCASACVYAFAGARDRQVGPEGRIGVHMYASTHGGDVLAMIAQLVREHGQEGAAIVARRLEQRSAAMTLEVAAYLEEMAIPLSLLIPTFATPPDRVHWLSRDELRAFRLTGAR
ncbi:MAG TPA: hypothetical protein PKA13_15740 [Geminicoccaceae bacterium]|nr:hypothetical protein [Geminicoccus sp.]HMU51226.1 hypothetical protein [Geminicoccaceae bacterium]